MGLAQKVVRVVLARVGAQHGHGLGDGCEKLLAVASLFHLVVPPGLAIGIAGGFGHAAQRVCTQLSLFTIMAQRLCNGQVDKARRHGGVGGPAQGLPLGRELGEGVVNRAAGLVRCITQQCHGRRHAFVQHRTKQSLGFGRAFDQHAVWRQCVQRPHQAARAAWAVVADAEKVQWRHVS